MFTSHRRLGRERNMYGYDFRTCSRKRIGCGVVVEQYFRERAGFGHRAGGRPDCDVHGHRRISSDQSIRYADGFAEWNHDDCTADSYRNGSVEPDVFTGHRRLGRELYLHGYDFRTGSFERFSCGAVVQHYFRERAGFGERLGGHLDRKLHGHRRLPHYQSNRNTDSLTECVNGERTADSYSNGSVEPDVFTGHRRLRSELDLHGDDFRSGSRERIGCGVVVEQCFRERAGFGERPGRYVDGRLYSSRSFSGNQSIRDGYCLTECVNGGRIADSYGGNSVEPDVFTGHRRLGSERHLHGFDFRTGSCGRFGCGVVFEQCFCQRAGFGHRATRYFYGQLHGDGGITSNQSVRNGYGLAERDNGGRIADGYGGSSIEPDVFTSQRAIGSEFHMHGYDYRAGSRERLGRSPHIEQHVGERARFGHGARR